MLYQVELQRYVRSTALVGFEPTTPGSQSMYSEPAVGLYSMGDEVMARAILYPLSYAPRTSCESRDGWTRTNNRCTPNRQSALFHNQSKPNEVVAEIFT